jgi:Transposase DDE domain
MRGSSPRHASAWVICSRSCPIGRAIYKRRERLSDTIEALIAEFASHSPGSTDDVLLVDSTPVECARSRETVRRGGQSSLADALSDAADYGYCASHSRYFYGSRLHTLFAMDGTPRALALTSPKIDEKDVCLQLVARCKRQPGQFLTLIGDKNFRGKQFETDLAALGAAIHRPRRKDEPGKGLHLAPIRQRIESIYWTAKDILTSNATAPVPCTACAPVWFAAFSRSPRPSRSTTASVCPAAPWPSTPPEPVELLI